MRVSSGWRRTAGLVSVLLLAGCGGGGANGGATDTAAWSYPEHRFVLDDLRMPVTAAEAREFGFDLDHDGAVDNRLGEMLTALAGAMSGGSPQDSVDLAIGSGSLIILLSIYAEDILSSARANAWAFAGEPVVLTDGPKPGMTFTVDPDGPSDSYFGGRVKDGVGLFGGDEAALVLRAPFTDYGTLDMPLQAVRMEFDVSADGRALENARLGGAVTEAEMRATVLPRISELLDAVLAANCADRGGTGGSGVCGCVPGSGTATIQDLFDADADCFVTQQEVEENRLLAALLAPDVVLADGQRALSIGVGFHAVEAAFDHPPPPRR